NRRIAQTLVDLLQQEDLKESTVTFPNVSVIGDGITVGRPIGSTHRPPFVRTPFRNPVRATLFKCGNEQAVIRWVSYPCACWINIERSLYGKIIRCDLTDIAANGRHPKKLGNVPLVLGEKTDQCAIGRGPQPMTWPFHPLGRVGNPSLRYPAGGTRPGSGCSFQRVAISCPEIGRAHV